MESSDCVPTEDAVQTLIDFLVSPLLPAKPFFSLEPPSLVLQESVAKQVQAVVLLYNYFHRKRFPLLEFLDFKSACMMVSIAKPSLMPFMKVMFAPEEFSNSSVQLSILENMIDEACGICSCLETTADEDSLRTWPKSKVAVLLVDQTLGFCFLKSSSIICGLWSLIEKAIELSILSEEENFVSLHNGDDFLLQFAFQAVKEKTGLIGEKLTVLEQGAAYSLSKQKTTVQFYVMEYHGTFIDEFTKVSVKDVIESLQGPLFRKDLSLLPAVEYFHLLPYASILSGWLSRQKILNDLLPSLVCNKSLEGNSCQEIRSAEAACVPDDGHKTSIVVPRRRSRRLAEAQERNCLSRKSKRLRLRR